MILLWIAGFMFTVAYLNKCTDDKGSCSSKILSLDTLKFFFLWPFHLGKSLSSKCSSKNSSCDDKTDEKKANSDDKETVISESEDETAKDKKS